MSEPVEGNRSYPVEGKCGFLVKGNRVVAELEPVEPARGQLPNPSVVP